VNSRWSRRARLALLTLALVGCGGEKKTPSDPAHAAPIDPIQAEAQQLGLELRDIVDRVMSYRSSHSNRLPASLRQAGIDSLTPEFIRRLARQGADPQITIVFRRTLDHQVRYCQGTNLVLEDAALHEGAFEVSCAMADGGTRAFTVAPPPPPPPAPKN